MTTLNGASLKLEKREKKLQRLNDMWLQKLQKHQQARLMTALVFFASLIPLAMNPEATWQFIPAGLLLVGFIFLVMRTKNILRHLEQLKRFLVFVTRQKLRTQGLPSGRAWKSAHEDSANFPMIRDLGLTGAHSLWTLLDETMTEGGQRRLLYWLSVPPLAKDVVVARQQQVQKLRSQVWFYTKLNIQTLSQDLNLSTLQIQEFLKDPFVGAHFSKTLALNVVVWIVTIVLYVATKALELPIPAFVFMIFTGLSWFSFGSVGAAFSSGVGLTHHLGALAPIFGAIERRARRDKALQTQCPNIVSETPSKDAKRMEFILGFVGTQTNPLLHYLLNAFSPWTLVSVYFLERHRQKISKVFPLCVAELSEFEVLGSLLILDKYQTQTYPEFSADTHFHCEQAFHPLLDRSRAVANDFTFPPSRSLGLLTGSNMSGKSTFLRTLGVNQVLANMGAPVFAKQFTTVPLKIETCIEVTDSLRDGYSYFYAEVRRLRDILQTAATKVPVLFLIDEIFRGTNNRERQIGSRAVIKTLAKQTTAIGFISTHDLELTTLEASNPTLINLHFREDIDDSGKMIFSYQLKAGPCPTTNALRIMQAEGINVDEA